MLLLARAGLTALAVADPVERVGWPALGDSRGAWRLEQRSSLGQVVRNQRIGMAMAEAML